MPELWPFLKVVVGVDGTSTGRDAITLAERLRAHGGQLTLAHVVLAQSPTYRNLHATPLWKDRRAMLARERAAIGVTAELTGMFAGSVGSGLHALAEDCDADLLVVGSSGRGRLGRVLVGDDARATVTGATCPVAVAPHGYSDQAHQIGAIGVAYNDSVEASAALAIARNLARATGARIVALTVVNAVGGALGQSQDPGAVRMAQEQARDRLRSLDGVEGRVAVGEASMELLAFGDEVDLLIMGSRGYGPLRRLVLGSASLQLTREARCPLVIVPRPAVADRGS